MSAPTLRPCPFCGSTDLYRSQLTGSAVVCAKCLARGPSHYLPEWSMNAWNGMPRCPVCDHPHEPQCGTEGA